jgi:uncharacterized repeat protein (TIGR01451 family)
VSLTKSASSLTPNVGSNDTFTLTASNAGASASGQVVVTDVLAAGLAYASSTTATGTIVDSGNTVTWTIANLTATGAGSSATAQIVVTVDANSTVTNTATFTQTTPNATGGTTGSSNTVTLDPSYAVVSLTKSASTTTPYVASNDTFTLTASNAGPSASGRVVVTDVLAAGLAYVSSTTGTGTIVDSGNTITWTIANLTATGAGSSATAQIVVTVNATSTVTNTATFAQTTPDATGGTTGSSNTVLLTPYPAVVSLTKSASSLTPEVGSDDTFTLSVSNAGPAASGRIVVTDVLAAGLAYVSSTTATGTIGDSGQTVTWTISNLTPTGAGSSATAQIVVTVNTSSSVSNTATFTQAVPNATGGRTGSSNTVTLTPIFAVVSLTKTASSLMPNVGSDDTFTLTASSSGPDAPGRVVVTDVLAAGLAYVSSTTGTGTIVDSGQTVTWTIADLTATGVGSNAVAQIVVTVRATSMVTNTATFTQTIPNATGGTTGRSNSVTLNPSYAVVTLTKSVSSLTPNIGSNDTFTVTASNSGPSASGQVVVTDVLAAGLTYVSSSTAMGTIGHVGQTVTWTIPNLASGSSATAQIVVTVTATSTVTNTAAFAQTAPNATGGTTGRSNTVTLSPVAVANVSINKTAQDATPRNGTDDDYYIVLTNDGPNAAQDVVVVDALPAGLEFVSASADQGAVSEIVVGGVPTIRWVVGTLADGATVTLVVVTRVVAHSGSIVNTGIETQTTKDPSGQRKSSTVSVVVTPQTPPVVVPPAHTGKPWAGWPYWLLVMMFALSGASVFESGRRRRLAVALATDSRSSMDR